MKYLLLVLSLIVSGCCKGGPYPTPPKEEEKVVRVLVSSQVELARCVCAKYHLLLNEVVRNKEQTTFTCRNAKTNEIKHLYVWDDTYVEGCTK